jgi:hypothetical protein
MDGAHAEEHAVDEDVTIVAKPARLERGAVVALELVEPASRRALEREIGAGDVAERNADKKGRGSFVKRGRVRGRGVEKEREFEDRHCGNYLGRAVEIWYRCVMLAAVGMDTDSTGARKGTEPARTTLSESAPVAEEQDLLFQCTAAHEHIRCERSRDAFPTVDAVDIHHGAEAEVVQDGGERSESRWARWRRREESAHGHVSAFSPFSSPLRRSFLHPRSSPRLSDPCLAAMADRMQIMALQKQPTPRLLSVYLAGAGAVPCALPLWARSTCGKRRTTRRQAPGPPRRRAARVSPESTRSQHTATMRPPPSAALRLRCAGGERAARPPR